MKHTTKAFGVITILSMFGFATCFCFPIAIYFGTSAVISSVLFAFSGIIAHSLNN